MLLAIDIGNTTIAFGLMQGQRVTQVILLETNLPLSKLSTTIGKTLRRIKRKRFPLQGIMICSVVPGVLKVVGTLVHQILKQKPMVIGKDVVVPIVNRYRNPKQVGQDRLVCAYAAMALYGTPAIIIDFGTAITFDAVSKRREYLGGIIVPGIRLSAESLFKKTALLPLVSIKSPSVLIGKDTQSSILSGLFYGYGAMTTGLIQRIQKEFKERPVVVVTGGYTDLIKRFFGYQVNVIDQHLVFKGMQLLFPPQ